MAATLLTAQDANWNIERGAFNILVDQQPAGIAVPRSADDVSDVVRSAAADGKRVAAQRTGHNAVPLGSLANTVLVHTAGLGGVQIDAEAGSARVGAGALWEDVVPKASELGLAALHGSAPNVGIVGYTIGGGVSFYHRKHGLACNRVTAIELVTAGGEQIRVDAENEPDLFWALRGGGGSFGVVTALEFDLLPLPEIFAGALLFPAEQASEVLQGWREWTSGMPEEMTSVGRLMNFPPIPEVPESVRGKSLAVLEVIYCGAPADGEELVAPLRKLGRYGHDSGPAAGWYRGAAHGPPFAGALYQRVAADSRSAGVSNRLARRGGWARLGIATGLGRAAPRRWRSLPATTGRWSARHPTGLVYHIRRWLRPGARSDGAEPRLARGLQGGARALRRWALLQLR